MKYFKCACMPILAAAVFLLASCGGGSSEKSTTTESVPPVDSTATKAPPPVNSIVTTPMNMVVIQHKVANFSKWMMAYEGHDSARLAAGLHNYVIGRALTDTNMVMVALRADDIAKAKAFTKDPGLKKAMQQGGVTGAPEVMFITCTWQDTVHIDTRLRARTSFSVKDAAAWQKGFEDGKQERLDNGITDRLIGHDADDEKKVSIVTALSDTAKAFAYYKSDALKKRREAGGVIGNPVQFIFTIVKRY